MKNKIISAVKNMDFPVQSENLFYIEMFSNDEIIITGNICIEELGNELIHLKTKDKHFIIFGTKLKIVSYSVNGIRIYGNIAKIEFS